MKAVQYSAFGAAKDVVEVVELAKPEPAHGEVLVRVYASGVNPSDTKKRAGAFPDLLRDGPVVPNSDGAGVIEAVGNGVSVARIGQRVWIYQAQYERRLGTAAQYVAIDARRAVPLPQNVTFEVGASLGIPAMTAHRCVYADGPVGGKLLLVTGGAGRVGHYAVQWAKLGGATVIATASSDTTRADCFAAGADIVVNHHDADWDQQILEWTQGRKVDRVIDTEFGANLSKVLEVIRIGGAIATYSSMVVPEPTLPFKRMMFMDLTLRMVIVYAMPEAAKAEAIEALDRALARGDLIHRITARFPLEKLAEASDLVDAGGICGSVILEVTH
ncbi:NADPH:quinone reductase [Paracoccus angustae]|uniref:NADPH:quinone reductase n=1 Tax=Paracoccus angustae TaxID=1671480 RepID=A0ABV7U8U0_9RHOB